jgi:hypothetical protein
MLGRASHLREISPTELLGPQLWLKILIQHAFVVVLGPLLPAFERLFVKIVRGVEGDPVGFGGFLGKKLARFLASIGKRDDRILSDVRPESLASTNNEPGLPIFPTRRPNAGVISS